MSTIRVPATIANMGPGFDTFGMAVNLYNLFHFERAEQDSLCFLESDSLDNNAADSTLLEREAAQGQNNILFQAMNRLCEQTEFQRSPYKVSVEANIPMCRGLGSSSTAIIAGLLFANSLLHNPLSQLDLLQVAIQLEGHPDNVSPAMLGGVVLYDEKPYVFPWPVEWRVLVMSPDYPVQTEAARSILPKQVEMADAIYNLRKSSLLTYALLQEDPDAFRHSLHDRLHQPYRKQLIPEFDELNRCLIDAGAMGMIISGSGSTMAAFYPTVIHASLIQTVREKIEEQGWQIQMNDVTVDRDGAHIISKPMSIL